MPLLLRIKDDNIQPIDNLLTTHFGYWKEIPFHELVILIDGLDEAPSNQINECTKFINEFIKSYSDLTVVFTCRKFFYEEYQLNEFTTTFKPYELYPLQYNDVNTYITSRLPTEHEQFWNKIYEYNLNSILYYPFYLAYLVGIFIKQEEFPTSRVDALQNFIKKEYSNSKRRLPNGKTLSKEKEAYFKILQKFAFALQLSGLNSYAPGEIAQLFSNDEKSILEQASLITAEKGRWSFINALFQEHLAALRLADLDFNKIISIISIGKTIKKVKTKWVQSYCTLVSFIDEDEKLERLVQFLRDDNPEIIFKTEKSKYPLHVREVFFEDLLKQYNVLGIRSFSIDEYTIAQFVDDSEKAADILIDYLKDRKVLHIVKISCTKVLSNLQLNQEQASRLFNYIKGEIPICNNSYYAELLLELLVINNFNDTSILDKWIVLPINKHHNFRDGMYQLISKLNLVDQYYDYGLLGIDILVTYNKEIGHSNSEYELEQFLLRTKDRSNITKLFKHLLSKEWREFNYYKLENFYEKLATQLPTLVEIEPLVVFQVFSLIIDIESRAINISEFRYIVDFITKSDINTTVLGLCIGYFKKKNKIIEWRYGELISPKCYDYILFEYEEGTITLNELQNLQSGMQMKENAIHANEFLQLCKDATEGTIYPQNNYAQEYEAQEKIIKRNDIECLQSLESFNQGINKYFKNFGKKKTDEDVLYIDNITRLSRKEIYSNLIFRFLIQRSRNEGTIYYSDLSVILSNSKWFERFRIETIIDYTFSGFEGEDSLMNIAKEFYCSELKTADFTNTYWQEGDKHSWKVKEKLLSQIFKKFQFQTDNDKMIEIVWTDIGGLRGMKNDLSNNSTNISKLIISKLDEGGIAAFKMKLIENIKFGIKSENVLGTHVSLCEYLKIKQAKDLVCEIILNRKFTSNYDTAECIDIYLKLDGDKGMLKKIFYDVSDYNNHLYLHLVKILKDTYKKEIETSLLDALKSSKTESNIKIDIARHLSDLGSNDGFVFLIEYLKEFKSAPYMIQENIGVFDIDTTFALEQIDSIIYFLVDPQYEPSGSFADSAKHLVLEWINGFAAKSEYDLLLVKDFLLNVRDRFYKSFPQTKTDFNWYCIRIAENFRNSEKTIMPIKQVKALLNQID